MRGETTNNGDEEKWRVERGTVFGKSEERDRGTGGEKEMGKLKRTG